MSKVSEDALRIRHDYIAGFELHCLRRFGFDQPLEPYHTKTQPQIAERELRNRKLQAAFRHRLQPILVQTPTTLTQLDTRRTLSLSDI